MAEGVVIITVVDVIVVVVEVVVGGGGGGRGHGRGGGGGGGWQWVWGRGVTGFGLLLLLLVEDCNHRVQGRHLFGEQAHLRDTYGPSKLFMKWFPYPIRREIANYPKRATYTPPN